jgi:hypothetical protein
LILINSGVSSHFYTRKTHQAPVGTAASILPPSSRAFGLCQEIASLAELRASSDDVILPDFAWVTSSSVNLPVCHMGGV